MTEVPCQPDPIIANGERRMIRTVLGCALLCCGFCSGCKHTTSVQEKRPVSVDKPVAKPESPDDARYEKIFREAHLSIERHHVIHTSHLADGIAAVVQEGPLIQPYLLKLAKGDRRRGGWPYWALLCGSLREVGGDEGRKALQELAADPQADWYVREYARRALEGTIVAPDDR